MRILLCLLLVALLSPAFAAPWVSTRVPGAIIYTHPGQQALTGTISAYVQQELPRLADRLAVAHPGPYAIYAYTDRIEFLRDAGSIPYLQGVSYQPTGTVRIDATAETPVQQVLAHELTHSLLNQKLGTRIVDLPVWVNEGIAGYLSDPLTLAQARASAHTIPPEQQLTITGLEYAFDNAATRPMAYQQSRAMVAWLDTRFPNAVPRLLTAIAQGSSFPGALEQATQLTPETWLQRWQADIPAYVYWLPLLGSPVLYAPLALLVMLIAILRARKRQAEEEDTEEERTATEEDDTEEEAVAPPIDETR